MPSFSIEAADLWLEGPIVEVTFGLGGPALAAQAGQPVPTPVKASALVDTGASHSLVAHGLLGPLGLHPVGMAKMNTPSAKEVPCGLYAVRLTMPKGLYIDTTVMQAPPEGLAGQAIQALLGRDVLRYGILIYQGHTQQFTISF